MSSSMDCLSGQKAKVVYFSNTSVCKKINHDDVATLPELTSDREETDKKLVAFVRASQLPPSSTAMVRSLCGDIDIITLFIGHNFSDTQILIDNGSGRNRKIINWIVPWSQKSRFGNAFFFRKRFCI